MNKVEIGGIYHSNFCGDYMILDFDRSHSRTYYKIKFLQTGYETSMRGDLVKTGYVNDPYYPKIYGVGYLGELNDEDKRLKSLMYKRWSNMISRCYNINDDAYYAYGALGIKVCDRWHCFANFLNDVKYLPGFNDMINNPNIKYQLDKDILQQGVPANMKVYSPETCMFVPSYVNSVQVAIDHIDEHNNIYHNVIFHHNAYKVEIQVNNYTYRIGTYKDPIVAANAANHARRLLGLKILNTDVPFISQEEVNSQNIRTVPKIEMIKNK